MDLLRSPAPVLTVLCVSLLLLLGALAASGKADQEISHVAQVYHDDRQALLVLSLNSIQAGDEVVLPATSTIHGGNGSLLITKGGEGPWALNGTPPHIYDTISLAERPPTRVQGGTITVYGEASLFWKKPASALGDDVDLVWTVERGELTDTQWENAVAHVESARFPPDLFGRVLWYDLKVTDAGWSATANVLLITAGLSVAASLSLLIAFVVLRQPPAKSAPLARMESLVQVAEEARLALRGLRNTLRVTGVLLISTSFAAIMAVKSWSQSLRVPPSPEWTPFVLVIALALVGFGVWWLQYARVARLHRVWQTFLPPEV